MLEYETLLRRLNRIDKNNYHKSREIVGSYKKGPIEVHIDSAPKDPFLPPGRMRIIVPFKWMGYPEEFQSEPMSTLLSHFMASRLSEMNSKFMHIYRPTNIVIKRSSCLVGKRIEFRFDYHVPSKSRHIISDEIKNLVEKILEKISGMRYKNLKKSEMNPVFRKMVQTYEDQLEMRRKMKKEGISAFIASGSIIPRMKFSRRPMEKAIPFSCPREDAITIEAKNREIEGLAIYKNKTTLITGSNFQGKSTLLFGISTGFYNHVAGDGREFVLAEELPFANKESGRVVNNADISIFLKDAKKLNTLSASGSVSQMATMSDIMKMSKGFAMDEDESAVNFLIKSGISHVKNDRITPFSEISRKIGMTQVIAAGALGEMEQIADDVIVLENFVAKKVIRSGEPRKKSIKPDQYKIEKIRKFEIKEVEKTRIKFKSGEIPLSGPIKATIYERAQAYLIADMLSMVEPGLTPEENADKIWSKMDSIIKKAKNKNYSEITRYQLYYAISRMPFIK